MSDFTSRLPKFNLWKHALCWLLILGPVFFMSYGQVNQYTATRQDVGSIVFGWEHAIPFIPWTIVPYWSIDLLYGISLFICTSRRELNRHGYRLIAASLAACLSFLLFPLRFTFTRPGIQGVFGWLFRQLEQFDLPYNQAPSLHIILTWLLWLRFRQHLSGKIKPAMGSWFLLIAISVLTTWQHHVIDIISGFVAGVFISYVIPDEGTWIWIRPHRSAVRLAAKYMAGSVLFSAVAVLIPGGLILIWPAAALLVVAVGYVGAGTTVFQKNVHGQISISAHIILFPYLLAAWVSMMIFMRNIPTVSKLDKKIFLGSFPVSHVQQNIVFDLTAEFQRRKNLPVNWFSYPLLDLIAPDTQQLTQAVHKLNELKELHGTVLVCCALGLSRSATVVAAWMLTQGELTSVQQVIGVIKTQRPQVVFSDVHVQTLQQFKASLCLTK